MTATAFHGVRYLVADVKRSVDFYTTHLGFKLEHQQLPAFAAVALGPLKILVSGPAASGSRPLRGAGVTFRNAMETGPGGRQIQVLDPDGNPVELFEPGQR
jgi:glyoxylase I family protein